jgi:ribA/ribD-fused uncharacterized protein
MKFPQDDNLNRKFLGTGNQDLVEASPLDKIYGIGFKKEDVVAKREKWGLNQLGKAVMDVWTRIRNKIGRTKNSASFTKDKKVILH